MIIEELKKESIDLHKKALNNYIIYYFDSLKIGQGDEIEAPLDIENIYEAFLFSENKCLHIYREDGVKGMLYINDEKDEVILEEQIVKGGKNFDKFKRLVVKKYIGFDEDGQAYIKMVLPSKLIK